MKDSCLPRLRPGMVPALLLLLLFCTMNAPAGDVDTTPLLSPLQSAVRACQGDVGQVAADTASEAGLPQGAPSGRAAEQARLEALPPVLIPVEEASLASAINLVAVAAGMNYVAPAPEEFPEPVTLSTRINPWSLLQLLGERYRFSLHYKEGVWLFDREAVGSLVSKTYELRHTNLDQFKAAQNSFNMLGGPSGAGAETQAGGLVFSAQTQKIIEDLRELVGLPSSALARGGEIPAEDGRRPVKGEAAGFGSASKSNGRVLYLPDANALYITATRQQHEHVSEYLRIVDQPVKQVRIEARFFETSHDPKTVLGMDPSGYQPGVTLSNIRTKVDLGNLDATPYPDKVLLSMDDLRFQLQALETDEKSKLVNNPTVVVANNREAYFSVGDEEPFVSANSYNPMASDAGFGTTQAQVAIRRIGTSVNVVPTLFPGTAGSPPTVRLAVRIEVGVLKGFRRINTVDVPVVTSQKYEYTVFLREGETLAFGGLTGSFESETVKKVPVAGDIPVLGYLFKSRSKSATQRNLVAYLTASVVGGAAAP